MASTKSFNSTDLVRAHATRVGRATSCPATRSDGVRVTDAGVGAVQPVRQRVSGRLTGNGVNSDPVAVR